MAKEYVTSTSRDSSTDRTKEREKENEELYEYRHKGGIVELHASSLKKLSAGHYLNDEIINFYLSYLLNEKCSKEMRPKIQVFDTYFYGVMKDVFSMTDQKAINGDKKSENNEEENQAQNKKLGVIDVNKWKLLSKWFSNSDIFDKSFLIFPVCELDHWFALIVCYPSYVANPEPEPDSTSEGKTKHKAGIIIMDSLNMKSRFMTRELRDFLDFEWRNKGLTAKSFSYHNLEEYKPPLPRQTNAYDCGIFMLAYLMAFIKDPEKFYRQVRKGGDKLTPNLSTSVHNCISESSRESIKNLIPKVSKFKKSSKSS